MRIIDDLIGQILDDEELYKKLQGQEEILYLKVDQEIKRLKNFYKGNKHSSLSSELFEAFIMADYPAMQASSLALAIILLYVVYNLESEE